MKYATLIFGIVSLITTVAFGVYHIIKTKRTKGKYVILKE